MSLRLTVATILVSLIVAGPRAHAQDRLLFVGNSYTFYSGGLEVMVDNLMEEATGAAVDAQAVTAGGYRLTQHLEDADGTNGERPLRQALVTGDNTEWDLVVLQGQSQIPAFPMVQTEWTDSRDAAVSLNELIAPTGAHTMFFLTWGRRDGDSRNPGRFPDFSTMQGYLTAGYEAFRDVSSSEVRPTYIAPVGVAFELVYDDVAGAGDVPEDSGTSFYRLYASDGSHPSTEGSYLAACVMFAAYTGLSPESLEWAPVGVAAGRRDYLQAIAAESVFDATDWLYPTPSEPSEDVGPGDVGPDIGEDVGGADAGDDAGIDDVGSDDVGSDVSADSEPIDVGEPDAEPADVAEPDSGGDAAAGDAAPSDGGSEDTPPADVSVDAAANEAGPEADDADTDESAAAAPESGGCSSARGSSIWLAPLLALAIGRRRSGA